MYRCEVHIEYKTISTVPRYTNGAKAKPPSPSGASIRGAGGAGRGDQGYHNQGYHNPG